MRSNSTTISRPVALVILDGWGYAPRNERNAIAMAHTPYYDEICRSFPMTTLSATGMGVGESDVAGAEVGHLRIGTGRNAQTEVLQIGKAIDSGAFMKNEVLNSAFAKAKANGASVHFIGLLSDGGKHSSPEHLFALLRMAKQHSLDDVFVHCILDGLDVPARTADVYVEALELKLSDIGTGRIASLCGRYFAMDGGENWERTARAYTMLVHGEGERANDAVAAIRRSFLRGISDEFILPIILENPSNAPIATIKDGDLVVYLNYKADGILQLVRSVSVPDESPTPKPSIDSVCLNEYDQGLGLQVAFRREPEKNTLAEVLSGTEITTCKITETARFHHLTHFFDGGSDASRRSEHSLLVPAATDGLLFGQPESESFKVTDKFLSGLESKNKGVFVVNLPAADLMAATGDVKKTIAAIQYIDTCLGGIWESMRGRNGVVFVTSSHGNCEEMLNTGKANTASTANPVPFHFIDEQARNIELRDNGSLEDIAPTLLGVLGIEKPSEMTGSELRML